MLIMLLKFIVLLLVVIVHYVVIGCSVLHVFSSWQYIYRQLLW